MHYGGEAFVAFDKRNHQRIQENTELSPLDIEKLNYYYPPISKLSSVGLSPESGLQ